MRIPWSKPEISPQDVEHVASAVTSTWISGGEYSDRFKNNLKINLGTDNLAVVCNGTAALASVFLAIGIRPGDEVIVPAFGFMAVANILKQMNAKPIFIDVDSQSWCAEIGDLERRLTPNTRAVVLIHSYGNSSKLHGLTELIRSRSNAFLIEDSAEAFGGKFDGRTLGTFGDFGTYSFHATKSITSGEGGAVTWKNSEFSEKIELMISHGLDRKRDYFHKLPGNNFRLSNICAALGFSQLQRLPLFLQKRTEIDKKYRELLSGLQSDFITFQKLSSPEIVPWSFPIQLKAAQQARRQEFITHLAVNGIETRCGFVSPDKLSYFQEHTGIFPNAIRLSESIVSLPAYPALKDDEIAYISKIIVEYFTQ